MEFRTEIDIKQSERLLHICDSVMSLGSCFSQAIGNRLLACGLSCSVTPLGVLFNPLSIANILSLGLNGKTYVNVDLYKDSNEIYHLLDLESRRQDLNPETLLNKINDDFNHFISLLSSAKILLITFGTAWCFRHIPTGRIVGNCHKLPDCEFERELCSIETIINIWADIVTKLPRIIFTVSPVRHLNNGLHGNTLSKSRLHLAIEMLCQRFDNCEYFPAFEILNDDLRDYRFYADDLKHPSPMAEEYIFQQFLKCYFNRSDIETMRCNRKRHLQLSHRPIIK